MSVSAAARHDVVKMEVCCGGYYCCSISIISLPGGLFHVSLSAHLLSAATIVFSRPVSKFPKDKSVVPELVKQNYIQHNGY